MQRLTIKEILHSTGGTLLSGSEETEITSVTTDSRTVRPGGLFIPIKGEKADGHDFIPSALTAAAAALTEREEKSLPEKPLILVKSTVRALGDIAAFYKQKYNVPTVGITGSVGKTTTKDMIASVAAKKYRTLKTQGNYNNEIGLPLTVLGLEAEHEAAVLEMGMSDFGEIHYLAEIAKPNAAVITNIGMSHIERLGSREGILRAKLEICDFLERDGVLIVNGDDEYLSRAENYESLPCRVIKYGMSEGCDVTALDPEDLGIDGSRFRLRLDGREYTVRIKTPGIHNIGNALAAACVGQFLKIPPEDIIAGLENFELTKMRMSVEKIRGMTVINDCYNASPDSVRAALRVLRSAPGKRRIAVLGDILEMGGFAEEAHYALGADAAAAADVLVAIGKNAQHIAQGAEDAGMNKKSIYRFPDTEAACEEITRIADGDDAVLIKASRGMRLERIYEKIKNTEELN